MYVDALGRSCEQFVLCRAFVLRRGRFDSPIECERGVRRATMQPSNAVGRHVAGKKDTDKM